MGIRFDRPGSVVQDLDESAAVNNETWYSTHRGSY
jgi:hypothetical protein